MTAARRRERDRRAPREARRARGGSGNEYASQTTNTGTVTVDSENSGASQAAE